MGLQVWLPLNGNITNQGLTTVTLSSGTPTYTNGKLGKCLGAGSLVFNVSNNLIVNLGTTNVYTMCCWCKNLDASATARWTFSIGNGSGAMRGMWERNSTTSRHWAYSGSGVDLSTSINTIDGNWHHICFTSAGSVVKLYVDGIYQSQVTSASTTAMTANIITLNANNYNLNDFRLYDHALSPREVKEISKGLVLHYPLASQYETGQVNLVSHPYSDGEFSSCTFDKTQLQNERGWHYTFSYTGNGDNYWPNGKVPNYQFTVGKKYYYSLKVRCNKWTAGNLTLRASRSDNDWVTNGVQICNSGLADGKWREYYVSQTVNSTYDRSGATITCNPVLEVYCSNLNGNGTVYDFDFDIKDIQVVEATEYTPFIDSRFVSTTVADVSGYGHNGTRSGILECSSDTPRYETSTVFSGNQYIVEPNEIITTDSTIALWVKSSLGQNAHVLDARNNSGIGKQPIYQYTNGAIQTGGNADYVTSNSGLLVANTWVHVVLVQNGNSLLIYKNGDLFQTISCANSPVIKPTLGARLNFTNTYVGQISDFRVYSTALSADDILELYHTPETLANNGTLLTQGEFVES